VGTPIGAPPPLPPGIALCSLLVFAEVLHSALQPYALTPALSSHCSSCSLRCENPLATVLRAYLASMTQSTESPIFVVAPPRSGGLLLASAISARRRFSAVPADADPASPRPPENGRPAPLFPPRFALQVPSWQRLTSELPRLRLSRSRGGDLGADRAWEAGEKLPTRTRRLDGTTVDRAADPGLEELKGKDVTEIAAVSGLQSPRPRWPISKSSTRVAGRSQTQRPPRRPEDPHRPALRVPRDRTERGDHAPLAHVREELQTADRRCDRGRPPRSSTSRRRDQDHRKGPRDSSPRPEGHVQAMPSADSPLRSVYSAGMRELVGRLDGSILVSTYQTGS